MAVAAAVFTAVCLVAVVAITLLGTSSHPDRWDPRVDDLVAFVEVERGLRFDHPVHIDFLTPSEYSDMVRSSEGDLTDDDREMLDGSAAMLRSVGLLDGDIDLFGALNELGDGGTLAFYDHVSKRIVVRGTEMSVDLEVTLVHELVHALQDQHFDLSRLSTLEGSGESTAFRAIVEGDATAVEDVYISQLSWDEYGQYEDALSRQYDELPIAGVPGILTASFSAPYALGAPLVGIVQAERGWEAVDDLLREPPTTELELLDPTAFLDGFEPVHVGRIELPEHHDLIEEGDFGAIGLYLMLAARLDPLDALAVADLWAGDAYLTSSDGAGRVCTQITVATSAGPDGLDRMVEGLEEWARTSADRDDGGAEVERQGSTAVLRSCDPGTDVEVESLTDPNTALSIPATRSYLILNAVGAGLSVDGGACVVEVVFGTVPTSMLVDPSPTAAEILDVQTRVGNAVTKCRGHATAA
ncbi:MAG: hypothetical protein JJE52_02355 [Acidimicrobiia bacterium]|nr:hypothetical protein [Acidimicrobiia bacterium]